MIDIDVDLSPEAKAHVTEYLRDKFGEERCATDINIFLAISSGKEPKSSHL